MKKKNLTHDKIKNNKAITLIALIITIIILLILSIVTIGAIRGDGIIGHAKNSVNKYATAQEEESEILEQYEELIENSKNPNLQKANLTDLVGKSAVTKNTEATDSNGEKVVIPAGCSVHNDTTTVDKGVVIQDEKENEWVWIPAKVSEISEVLDGKNVGILYNFTYNSNNVTKIEYSTDTYHEPDIVTNPYVDQWLTNKFDEDPENLEIVLEGKYANSKTATSFKEQLQEEFDTMLKSVENYGGYYVGRYETAGDLENPVVKNATAITGYNWYNMYASAKKLKANDNVTTTMVWGCQWDNMLRWLVSSKNVENYTTLNNPSYWKEIDNKVGNLYGLCNDVSDWTSEAGIDGNDKPYIRSARGNFPYQIAGSRYCSGCPIISDPKIGPGTLQTFRAMLIIN